MFHEDALAEGFGYRDWVLLGKTVGQIGSCYVAGLYCLLWAATLIRPRNTDGNRKFAAIGVLAIEPTFFWLSQGVLSSSPWSGESKARSLSESMNGFSFLLNNIYGLVFFPTDVVFLALVMAVVIGAAAGGGLSAPIYKYASIAAVCIQTFWFFALNKAFESA